MRRLVPLLLLSLAVGCASQTTPAASTPFDWCGAGAPSDDACFAAKRDPASANVALALAIAQRQATVNPKADLSWSWGGAVQFGSFVDLHRVTGNAAPLAYAQKWLDLNLAAGYAITSSDTSAPVGVAVPFWQATGDAKYKKPIEDFLTYIDHQALRTPEGGLNHLGTTDALGVALANLRGPPEAECDERAERRHQANPRFAAAAQRRRVRENQREKPNRAERQIAECKAGPDAGMRAVAGVKVGAAVLALQVDIEPRRPEMPDALVHAQRDVVLILARTRRSAAARTLRPTDLHVLRPHLRAQPPQHDATRLIQANRKRWTQFKRHWALLPRRDFPDDAARRPPGQVQARAESSAQSRHPLPSRATLW